MLEKFQTNNQTGVFSITQWNTLADCLSDSFPRCPKEYLKWEHRSQKHIEHLTQRALSECICLEEVDHPELFQKSFETSHEVLFHKKPDGKDGQLVAVSRQKFKVVEKEAVQYQGEDGMSMNQSFWYLQLQENSQNSQGKHNNLLLFVTHLKAKFKFEEVREVQINHFFKYLKKIQSSNPELTNTPVIFTGDFNAEPTYKCIQFIQNYGIFQSAYDYNVNKLTTYKIREPNDVQCRVIDYIFYTPSTLHLLSTKGLPTQEEIGENGLPNQQFSSDHLSISGQFLFK